jgi:hypothetical protein
MHLILPKGLAQRKELQKRILELQNDFFAELEGRLADAVPALDTSRMRSCTIRFFTQVYVFLEADEEAHEKLEQNVKHLRAQLTEVVTRVRRLREEIPQLADAKSKKHVSVLSLLE